ncbi:helix-turn-helix domain-containing protein [Streptomyces decoyicus]
MPGQRDDEHAVRLALACFRYEAACMERKATIRWVREIGGWTMQAIADRSALSPSTIGRLVNGPGALAIDEVRALRARWGVDQDPASRAAADHIVAHLIADEFLSVGSIQPTAGGNRAEPGVSGIGL